MKYPEDHTVASPPRIRFLANPMKETAPSGCLLHANPCSAWAVAVEPPLDCDPAESSQKDNDQFANRRDIGLDETDKLLRRGVMAISLLSLVAIVHFLLCSQ